MWTAISEGLHLHSVGHDAGWRRGGGGGVDSLLAVLVLHYVCSPGGCCGHTEPGANTRKVRFRDPAKIKNNKKETELLLWPHARRAARLGWIIWWKVGFSDTSLSASLHLHSESHSKAALSPKTNFWACKLSAPAPGQAIHTPQTAEWMSDFYYANSN